jgi:hypothetical protein
MVEWESAQFPERVRDFYVVHSVQTGTHPVPSPAGTAGSSTGHKLAGA